MFGIIFKVLFAVAFAWIVLTPQGRDFAATSYESATETYDEFRGPECSDLVEGMEFDSVAAIDGDTVLIGKCRVRLAAIDAPELKQKYGAESHAALAQLVAPGVVIADNRGDDVYGRPVIVLYSPVGVDINAEMVRTGSAFIYRDVAEYLGQQEQARTDGAGFWSGEIPMRPHEWRARNG